MCVKCSARTKLPLLFSIFLCPSKSCQEPTSPAINTLGAELTLQLQLPYIPPVPQMPLLLVLCVCMSSMMRLPELLIQVLHPPLCLCVCVRKDTMAAPGRQSVLLSIFFRFFFLNPRQFLHIQIHKAGHPQYITDTKVPPVHLRPAPPCPV